jgi:ribose transport system substrate-binding protein
MGQNKSLFWFAAAVALGAAAVLSATLRRNNDVIPYDADFRPHLALVVAGPDAFHQQVIVGAKQAAEDVNADLRVEVPDGTGEGQTATLVAASTEKINGLAVSPLAPEDQISLLSRLASQLKVVTYDNDVPDSLRAAYVGANNAMGGRLAAELVKKALPDGGKIAIFIGDNERENARVRRRSLLATLSNTRETATDETEPELEQSLEAGPYTVLGTYVDGSDPKQALANAERVLKDHPDVQAMVALYGYNGPACLKALKEADKLKTIPVIAFDEHDATLAGIEDGSVVGTVVQDPYLMGYKTIEELARLCRNDQVAMPLPGMGSFTLQCSVVDKDNLAEFRENVAKRMPKAEEPAEKKKEEAKK